MHIRLMTQPASAMLSPHVGECDGGGGLAVKQCNGGWVSAAGEAT